MSPRVRALLGAAAGALLVLAAHPATRTALWAPFRPIPPGGLAGLLAPPPLAPPTDRPAAAAVLHEGARRLIEGPTLSESERKSLVAVASAGVSSEASNAFWPLARSLFADPSAARRDWRLASRRDRYDDYQNGILLWTVGRIARQVQSTSAIGDAQAWIFAAVAPRRSQAMGIALKREAFRTLRRLKGSPERDEFVVQTIHNGATLRNFARQYRLAACGMEMIEGATYPSGVALDEPSGPITGIKRLTINKTNLTKKLSEAGRTEEARFCDEQFRINDSWKAFQDVNDPEGRFQNYAIGAVLAAALPGGFLLAGLLGFVLSLFARRVAAVAHVRSQFRGPGLAICSFVLLGAGVLAGSPWVGLTAGACALVPALGPDRPKRFGDANLGPMHAFLVGTASLGIVALAALTGVARSLPGRLLPELGPVGAWLGDGDRLAALLVALLGASALIAPGYAVVLRFSTPTMAAQTYRRIGRNVALVGIALAILASPVCLALDRYLGNTLSALAQNEPRVYGPANSDDL